LLDEKRSPKNAIKRCLIFPGQRRLQQGLCWQSMIGYHKNAPISAVPGSVHILKLSLGSM